MDKIEALREAKRRGILPPELSAAYDEAVRRRLIQEPQQRSLGDRIARGVEIGARNFSDSVLEGVAAVPDLMLSGMRATGLDVQPGAYADALKGARDWAASQMTAAIPGAESYAESIGATADMQPENAVESAVAGGARGAGDAATIMAPGAAVARLAKAGSVAQGAGRALASQPALQAAAGAAGGAVGEATGSPALGIAASLAVPAAGATAAGVRGARAANRARAAVTRDAPTTEQLKQAGSAAANRARANNAVIRPESLAEWSSGLSDDLVREIDPGLHPKAARVLTIIDERSANGMDVQDIMLLRRNIATVAKSLDPDERRIGKQMLKEFDNYVATLDQGDLAEGAIGTAADDLAEMRDLWTRMRKSEAIEQAIERAQRQGSGFENGLRVQFRQMLNKPKLMRAFTEDEKAAMRDVVEGNPVRNAARLLGKFGFDFQANTNAVGAALGPFVGSVAGSPFGPAGSIAGGAALAAIGAGSRRAAMNMTNRQAELARALTAQGGRMPAVSYDAAPTLQDNTRLLAQLLMAEGKAQAGAGLYGY